MKWITLLGLLLSAPALQAQASIIAIPVIPTNGQFIACWYSPPYIWRTNINVFVQPVATAWIPEYSTDGISWALANERVYLPPRGIRDLSQAVHNPCYSCPHFVEVGRSNDQVRIRMIAY